MKVFYHLFPTWYCCRYSPTTLMTKISSAMLILRLCYIVQRFLCSVRPDLIIPRLPKQSDGNHNIALQCQMLLGFHELIHKTGAAAQCGNLIFSYHYLSPKRSSVSASAFVCLSVHLNGASPHDSFLDAKESLSFNGNVNLNLMPYTLYLVPCTLVRSHPVSLVPAQECCHPARQTAPACLHRDYSGRSHHKPGLPLLTPCTSNAENACGHKREGIHIQPRVLKQLNRLVQK